MNLKELLWVDLIMGCDHSVVVAQFYYLSYRQFQAAALLVYCLGNIFINNFE
jgi:hypothetical protein